ncbi:hypothetical protein L0U88_16975 [Flavihumibacter sp. RY-1]|uniref:Uncharacterized protein n=1 Tax=Flavihumibacter fluminis TaxID=2909236 RepID=A0ABS9BKX2_9BACT|nr:hypothetical protein [Flavihumibacter fluminis]MCF1716338.1 hypothetical protein [Flavihumibacter fluminis]
MKKLLLPLAISCWNTPNYAQLKEQMNQYIDSIFKIDPNNPVSGFAITVIKDCIVTLKQSYF